MLKRIGRLFVIKSRWEAMAVIYALGLGAVDRGLRYLEIYPGVGGWLLFAACTGAVFMAGARLLEFTRHDNKLRRRKTDFIGSPQKLGNSTN
jgi:hypothetical protein